MQSLTSHKWHLFYNEVYSLPLCGCGSACGVSNDGAYIMRKIMWEAMDSKRMMWMTRGCVVVTSLKTYFTSMESTKWLSKYCVVWMGHQSDVSRGNKCESCVNNNLQVNFQWWHNMVLVTCFWVEETNTLMVNHIWLTYYYA